MGLTSYLTNSIERIQRNPRRGLRESIGELYIGGLRRIEPRLSRNRGVNVFDRDWDLCIVLDACRWDLMEAVEDEYEWFETTDTIWSVGATSPEWIERTFNWSDPAEHDGVAYVTWNGWSSKSDCDLSNLAFVDEVWGYAWDDDRGMMPPSTMSDRTIAAMRREEVDHVIAHYMQPHVPFVESDLTRDVTLDHHLYDGQEVTKVWDRLKHEPSLRNEIWKEYKNNLRFVLDDIEAKILTNVDAERAVITSDHGNGMGEFGQYGHSRRQHTKYHHLVPWYTFSCEDTGTYESKIRYKSADDAVADERLRELGYM
jgi:hypothetical protein